MSIATATDEDVPLFGRLVRQHRVRIRLTQRELADFSTISVRAIRDLEQGRARRPRQDTVRLIADALRLGPRARADLEAAATEGRTGWAVKAGYEAGPAAPPLATDLQVGREAETAVLYGELATGAERLVTVIGIDGVGRTRLALEVATRLHTTGGTPVLWCTLAEPAGGDRLAALVRAAAEQLLHPGPATDDIAALVETIADRPPLLVLDGVPATADPGRLVTLLRDVPGLRVMTTADRPLGLPGERTFLLNPLTVDETDPAGSPAVQLFLNRARRVRPDLDPDPADLDLMAGICRRLDGVPGALHAAASWLIVYDLATLHRCLHDDPATLLNHLTSPDAGAGLREALERRLAGLPAADRDLFEALCRRGDSFDLTDVTTLTGWSLPDSGRAVRALLLHGLIRPAYRAGQAWFRILHTARAAQLCAASIRG
ncbi:helix-turn-helix domain-containing protein [Actinoplanes oblitus]|uniref:Helix-turn-helix domain-containing protein n=1 Tax=Actinoplanes oblitus TaxID=3040509 RepID=A0ABY8WTN7_9ACTN|nr:helix-turn-helix domain-containing protein [Actinoplanes oblitus]WIN00183.1 helix-turn-helix domain-containing protein [Actinoplanes oblitus]